MSLVQFGDVVQNLLTLAVILIVFYLIYASMNEGKLKTSIRGLFEKLKMEKEK